MTVGTFVKQDVREWCPSTTGPLLPTMTDSLLAPGWEVLYKQYHTGELVEATILGPSTDGDDFVRLTSMIAVVSMTPTVTVMRIAT